MIWHVSIWINLSGIGNHARNLAMNLNSVRTTDTIDVDLREVIYALSDALDLVGIDDVGHGKRVGIMAAACAQG